MSKFSPSEKLTKKIENSQEEFLKKHGILAAELLDDLDDLVDGPFVEQLKDLELEFRGSSNQRFLKRHDIAMLRKAWLAGAGRSSPGAANALRERPCTQSGALSGTSQKRAPSRQENDA